MHRLIFITENANKYKELVAYLDSKKGEYASKITIQMVKPDYELHEIQSLNRTEIVTHKLQDAIRRNPQFLGIGNFGLDEDKIWIMVEDTSLCMDKQGGLPGPFIKYYLQSLGLNEISHANWGSGAQSYVNLAVGTCFGGNLVITHDLEGVVDGVICEPRGENGFGFDPIFRPNGSTKTNAEMNIEEKADFNPRTRAFQKALDYIFYK